MRNSTMQPLTFPTFSYLRIAWILAILVSHYSNIFLELGAIALSCFQFDYSQLARSRKKQRECPSLLPRIYFVQCTYITGGLDITLICSILCFRVKSAQRPQFWFELSYKSWQLCSHETGTLLKKERRPTGECCWSSEPPGDGATVAAAVVVNLLRLHGPKIWTSIVRAKLKI